MLKNGQTLCNKGLNYNRENKTYGFDFIALALLLTENKAFD